MADLHALDRPPVSRDEMPAWTLRIVARKGIVATSTVASSLDISESDAARTLRQLIEQGLCQCISSGYAVTPAGTRQLACVLAGEQGSLDTKRWKTCLAQFDVLDARVKQIVSLHQNGDRTVEATTAGLDELYHRELLPLLAQLRVQVPRLTIYSTRFAAALAGIRSGDIAWIAHPLRDSFHTIWFELHQDILDLSGQERSQ